MSKHRTFFFISIALIGILVLVLLLLFLPDMSSTLIDTIPEHPPELHLIDSENNELLQSITVSRDNVKNVVSVMKRPSEYFSKTESTLYHASGNATYSRQKWVKGELARVDIFALNSSNPYMHYIYSKDNVFVWRSGDRTPFKTARGHFEADDIQMMMSYEDIVSAEDDEILDARVTAYDSAPCIYAEIKKAATGYTEKYWVSYSTGLLVFGQTFDENGKLIYSIATTRTDVSTQSTDTFLLPDGNLPE